MITEDIKIAEKIIDKHAEFTDHYADQEYTKKGILKMMEEYTLYTEPVSEGEIEKEAIYKFCKYLRDTGTEINETDIDDYYETKI